LAPRLLAALGSQRERYDNAAEVQAYSGIAPVTERSGARSYYQQQRERGKRHHAAMRGLAFKDRVAYDESKYLAALAKRNSPLAAVAGGTIL